MEQKCLIDNKKIYEQACENILQGDVNFKEHECGSMTVEERVMLIAFTYIELMYSKGFFPIKTRNQLIRVINTKLQSYASEIERYRYYSKLQIEWVDKTDEMRAELTKAIKNFDDDLALQLAISLIDMYQSNIANSRILTEIYLNRGEPNEVESGGA